MLTWLSSNSLHPDVIEECVRAIAGLPVRADVESALQHRPVTELLARGVNESVKRLPDNPQPQIVNEARFELFLHAIVRLVQTAPPTTLVEVYPIVSLVDAGQPLWQWNDLGPRNSEVIIYIFGRLILLHRSQDSHQNLFNVEIPVLWKSTVSAAYKHMLAELVILARARLIATSKAALSVSSILDGLKSEERQQRYNAHESLQHFSKGISLSM